MSHSIRAASLAVLVWTAACSGSTSPTTIAVGSLHGEVTDAAGDAVSDARVPRAPDLVRATADVAAGNVTFVIQLAPGTLDRQTTRVTLLLDTDQDGSTGIRQGDGIGADYSLDLAASSGQATVARANAANCAAHLSCFDTIGSAPITVAADAMQVTVPLSQLGNDDGRFNFQMSAYVIVAPLTPVIFDFMPDNNAAPGRTQ